MAVTRTLGCPDCGGSFTWLFMTDDDWPTHCARCGNSMTDEPNVIPGVFNIGTNKGKTVDFTYRQMEESSNARAEMAGDPALKITNMNDGLKEGDVAGKVPVNAVTQVAGEMGHQFFQGPGGGVGGLSVTDAMALTKSGPDRRTGAVALNAIQDRHGGAPMAQTPIRGSFGGGVR